MQNVKFQRKDQGKFRERKFAYPIVELIKGDKFLIEIACDTIRGYRKYQHVIDIDDKSRFSKSIENICNTNKEYQSKLKNFEKLYKDIFYLEDYSKLSCAELDRHESFCNDVRGIILEKIIETQAKHRYRYYSSGCMVYIHDRPVNNNKKDPEAPITVDFAGINYSNGEIYEGKVSPNNFSQEKGVKAYELILLLRKAIKKHDITCAVGIVSVGSKNQLISAIKENFSEEDLEEILFIGKDELIELKSSFPIIA